MIVFLRVSFVIGCVDRMYQSFLSECVFFSLFFSIIFFGLVDMDFWPVTDKFSSLQVII